MNTESVIPTVYQTNQVSSSSKTAFQHILEQNKMFESHLNILQHKLGKVILTMKTVNTDKQGQMVSRYFCILCLTICFLRASG